MAFQPCPDAAQILVQMTMDSQLVENIFYVQKSGAWAAGDLQLIADTVDTWASGAYMPAVSPAVFYNRTIVRDLTTSGAPQAVSTVHAGTQGSLSGSQVPNNAAFAIHRNSVVTGKHSKSRVYTLGLTHDEMTSASVLSSSAANARKAVLDLLRTELLAMSGLVVTYGYLERIDGGAPLPTANFIVSTGHSYRDLYVDSQRRRLPGRGR